MKIYIKILLAYFPILLILLQLIANGLYFVNKDFYIENSFYISNILGQSLIFSIFLIAYTQFFNFCSVSRITAFTELIICISYILIKSDDIYNIVFQSLLMFISLLITGYLYIKKYPNCRVSLYIKAKKYALTLWENFLTSFAKSNFDCIKALEDYTLKRKKYYQDGGIKRV